MIDKIRNDKLEISVRRLGAELTSLRTTDDNTEFLWQGDARYWKGQSTILFPIIGRLPDGMFELDGKLYEMEAHGFARDSEFELVESRPDMLVYRISWSDETLRQYPYKFEFHVKYKIEGNILRHRFMVENHDDRTILFSVGGHPGFNCPLYKNEKMEDYRFVFEKHEKLQRRIKREKLLSGKREWFLNDEKEIGISHSLFYNGAVILDGVRSNWLEIRNSRNSRIIKVGFKGFPYLGIWSTQNDAPFVCIEPWFGIDSSEGDSLDITKKEGLQRLMPGACFECEYSIIID